VSEDSELSVVNTSEDSFETDNEGVIDSFNQRVDQIEENHEKNGSPKSKVLDRLLSQNVTQHTNIFGRKQVYLVASFNDWVPLEMHTNAETSARVMRSEEELKAMTTKALVKLIKTKKKEDNKI